MRFSNSEFLMGFSNPHILLVRYANSSFLKQEELPWDSNPRIFNEVSNSAWFYAIWTENEIKSAKVGKDLKKLQSNSSITGTQKFKKIL